jgi:hypothetical protein
MWFLLIVLAIIVVIAWLWLAPYGEDDWMEW